jgi:DNA-binding CsgD family transcriptional regulator
MVDRVSTAFEKLTPREREILRLIAAHLQSKEIARALGLSPKTVEMHVLSARRRLSGLSRRDAALAFIAWEGEDPGNDYRKQPGDLAELAGSPLPDREIGNEHDRAPTPKSEVRPGQETRPPSRAPGAQRNWRHDLTHLQWLGLILGLAALAVVLLAIIAIGLHEFILAIQRIEHY